MRKVENRLKVLEDRNKDLSPKQRAHKINEELKETFCVGESEVFAWKSIVKTMSKDTTNIRSEVAMASAFSSVLCE